MPDWRASMKQTFEFFKVEPSTWKDSERLDNIISATITRDRGSDTLESCSFKCESVDDEIYVRPYLVTYQNGVTERFPLGTFLMQTPSRNFNGKSNTIDVTAYSGMLEMKYKYPPIGYTVFKDSNIVNKVLDGVREATRAPIIDITSDKTTYYNFVSSFDENWLSFEQKLLDNADMRFDMNELGEIIIVPNKKIDTMTSMWEYTDDNSSILYPDVTINKDVYGIPNVVEVVYSGPLGYFYSKVVNDDPTSPISTVNRGREVVYRESDPAINGVPNKQQRDRYANDLLKALSAVTCTVSYKHGYCPVRVGDCVTLNYKKAGLNNVKAIVDRQSIECKPGCEIQETASFTTKLWEGK